MFSYLNPLPHLSKYKGPHRVGSTEFEIPVSEIQSTTTVPDARVTTIKFRIYYPTTTSAKSKQSIPWLPTPQKAWNQAYAEFMGASEKRASWMSSLPSILNYATIPAVQNAPLLENSDSKPYPVVIFSHGLGGNYNTYSSLIGSLASCGVICVAPEHRDGSAPTSFIKASRDKVATTIAYQKVSHSPTVEVLNARNAQLRVRMWELELVYSAISQMNQGNRLTNFADTVTESTETPKFTSRLDLQPGRVTWAGHSFGSATMVQFVKSVYYHKQAPQLQTAVSDQEWNMTPLYAPTVDSALVKQVTPNSPVTLLDLWTMPLRSETSRWLWEKPLPCHDRKSNTTSPNTLAVISTEFYKWKDLRYRTCAVLSANTDEALATLERTNSAKAEQETSSKDQPTSSISREISNKALPSSQHPPAEKDLKEPTEPEVVPTSSTSATEPVPAPESTSSTRTPSPTQSSTDIPHSFASSRSSLPSSSPSPAHLYLIHNSAHLSQSDFGPLFPNLTRYFMKALDPEKTIELNVRAIIAMMKGCGLDVAELGDVEPNKANAYNNILEDGVVLDRWERIRWDESKAKI